MDQKEKIAIVNQLRLYVAQKGSQNKAAAALKGASSAVVSHLLSGNWEPYTDDMFRKIGAQIGYNSKDWQFAPTTNGVEVYNMLEDAKTNALVLSIIGRASAGKSTATKKFESENKNVVRIECGQYWDRKLFLQEILYQLGDKNPSVRIADMMRDIVLKFKAMDMPQLIIDEVDKIDDKVLLFLITLYNELKGHCSIIILATYYLKKRFEDGIRLRKKGYEELVSRFGRFYELEDTTYTDIKAVCESNGLTDENNIKIIARNSKGDLRAVSDSIIALRIDEKRKLTDQ
ncbi:MAG: ATP-binding protein [Weeksellaceae bacterium]|nr:ATP-binding protein [Bacteroidota bacterium]MCG2780773.1 ATP-binding protein [Weeksellaceae bacterium]